MSFGDFSYQRLFRWIYIPCLLCFANIMCSTQETGEEGKSVTLKCTDSVVSKTIHTIFYWHKERLANKSNANIIAFYDNLDGVQNSKGDLANRATIDGTTGALTILSTKVSDDHFYSCLYRNTATGDIKNETQLTITVTPSQQDLKITTSATGPVKEGETVSFKCSASRVKPPPRQMYWQFTDDANQLSGIYRNETNADNLTSSVSVNYTLVVDRRKLVCHYVSEAGNDIQSEEAKVEVIYMPTGQPQIKPKENKTVGVNSTVPLTCDTGPNDGVITWYKWQFVNGTDLSTTTEKTWTYKARGNEETLQIVCIAGNAAGQSNASEPIFIEIKSNGPSKDSNGNAMYTGIAIGCALVVILIILGTFFLFRQRKFKDGSLQQETQVSVNYNHVAEDGEIVYAQSKKPRNQKNASSAPSNDIYAEPMKKQRNKKNASNAASNDIYAEPMKKNKKKASHGDRSNGNLDSGRTLDEDGLIYMQPEFLNGPGSRMPPSQATGQGPARSPKVPKAPKAPTPLADHVPTEYGEVDFNIMKNMKKK